MRQILLAENESIHVKDVEKNLQRSGYEVLAIAYPAEKTLKNVSLDSPDLKLKGSYSDVRDNILEISNTVGSEFDIPLIFQPVSESQKTWQQTKPAKPFGYLIKAIDEQEQSSTSEKVIHNHQTERRLKESEEWLSATINCMGDGVIATDKDGLVKFMNPIAEVATGWSQAEAIGKHITEIFNIINEVSRTIASNPILRALKQEEAVSLLEPTLLISRGGVEVPISDTTTPIRNKFQEITGAVLIFQDITVRRELELQLNQSLKMDAIGRLAGGVAHDFNNMMTVVIGYSELVLSKLEVSSPFHNQIKEIKKAGERAAALTRQLLAFSRKQILQPVELNLNETVKNLLRLLQRLIPENIEIITKLSEDLKIIHIDPTQIEQVILNLSINARDAMPDGGKLFLETANVYLDETYPKQHLGTSPGHYVMLAISDTGYGMSKEIISQIYEPFFTTKSPDKGTGFGLSIVFGIVQQSGGNIWVYSEPDEGTTFKTYFQCSPNKAEKTSEITTQQTIRQGTEVVLVVEDEKALLDIVCQILESNGYQTLMARNGQEALEIFEKSNTIDLVISDMIMPGMSGRILGERIKALRPTMKILYMSGYTDDMILHQHIEKTSIAFIQKPFTIEALARKVREVLDLS